MYFFHFILKSKKGPGTISIAIKTLNGLILYLKKKSEKDMKPTGISGDFNDEYEWFDALGTKRYRCAIKVLSA